MDRDSRASSKKKRVAGEKKTGIPKSNPALQPSANKAKKSERIARTLRQGSKIPLIIAAMVVIVLLVAVFWHHGGNTARTINALKNINIYKDIKQYKVQHEPSIIEVLERGVEFVPILIAKYPEMSRTQKIATVIIIEEWNKKAKKEKDKEKAKQIKDVVKSIEIVALLKNNIEGDDQVLNALSQRTAILIGAPVVDSFLLDIIQKKQKARRDLLTVIGQTRSKKAHTGLLALAGEKDAGLRAIVAYQLGYYGSAGTTIDRLLLMLSDENTQVISQAIVSFERIKKLNKLEKHAPSLAEKISQRISNNKDLSIPKKAAILSLMGIVGAEPSVEKKYREDFLQKLRNELKRENISHTELAAAAYGLGMVGDQDSIKSLIELLLHEKPIVASKAAGALTRLDTPLVVEKILGEKDRFIQSKQKHSLIAVAKVLEKQYSHVVQERLTKNVAKFLQAIAKNTSPPPKSIIKTLKIYVKVMRE